MRVLSNTYQNRSPVSLLVVAAQERLCVRCGSVLPRIDHQFCNPFCAAEEREEAPESRHRSSSMESPHPQQPEPQPPQQQLVSELQIHKTEVAAVQNSLSHLSMPQRPEEPRGPVLSDAFQKHLPQLKPRRQLSSRQLSNFGPGTNLTTNWGV
jgi:hypothetical protein